MGKPVHGDPTIDFKGMDMLSRLRQIDRCLTYVGADADATQPDAVVGSKLLNNQSVATLWQLVQTSLSIATKAARLHAAVFCAYGSQSHKSEYVRKLRDPKLIEEYFARVGEASEEHA